MENILVLLPKHRQEHGRCTAACALLQVFSYTAHYSFFKSDHLYLVSLFNGINQLE